MALGGGVPSHPPHFGPGLSIASFPGPRLCPYTNCLELWAAGAELLGAWVRCEVLEGEEGSPEALLGHIVVEGGDE